MASGQRELVARALRAQRARQMGGLPTAGFFGDILNVGKTILGAVVPGAGTVIDIAESAFGGGKKSATAPRQIASGCPQGTRVNPSTGVCEKIGIVGAVQRVLPGGATGTVPATRDAFGEAVIGAFGRPALVPAMSSTVTHRCPRGTHLGIDNLCYEKIPREFRKWKPGPKPPMSPKDWKALQTADRVRNKSKDIAMKAGWKCVKK